MSQPHTLSQQYHWYIHVYVGQNHLNDGYMYYFTCTYIHVNQSRARTRSIPHYVINSLGADAGAGKN